MSAQEIDKLTEEEEVGIDEELKWYVKNRPLNNGAKSKLILPSTKFLEVKEEEIQITSHYGGNILKRFKHNEVKIERNDFCPCGSRKKFKKCCMKK